MPIRITKSKAKRPLKAKEEHIDVSTLERPQPKKPAEFSVDPENGNIRYWLIKSEPYSRIDPKTGKDSKFSLEDLFQVECEPWDGVRNHEAKNNMLNMTKGDICLFYHSNAPTPGIVGITKVVNEAHPDQLQFDSKSTYYDAKSSKQNPKWWCVDVTFVRRLKAKLSLDELRAKPELSEMSLVKRGRLSVTPVRSEEFNVIMAMERAKEFHMDIDCDLGEEFVAAQDK
jgi:predicted RNA-binding protein with PUA-like domain